MSKLELGQNIVYDPQTVAEARRRDLRNHVQCYEEGLMRARAEGIGDDIAMFFARKMEAKASLRTSFPRSHNGV
ncbi:MAG: hypothetical protein M1372_02195 [Patescibacteria group bacterium]|nr:hypothetical protein [Patescibacteria group bacterium]